MHTYIRTYIHIHMFCSKVCFVCSFSRRFAGCLLFCGFCLVFLSCCMHNQKTLIKTTNLQEKQKNTAHPAGTWEIFIRGRVVGWMSCICCFSRRLLFVVDVLLLFFFLPSLFKLVPEHNTIHYTKHKQTWNGFVHDPCQLLKVMFKFISNYMAFAVDLKAVCIMCT